MNKLLIGIVVVALVGGVYWFGSSLSWWGNTVPSNLPTAEERERIRAVEESRMQPAADAKAGIQVREPGSTPEPAPTPEPTPEGVPMATTTATTIEETLEP